ncbi:cytochrome c family protein [Cereibacter johrii]|nr:cytochrome c family protein [Cereibacter johrii]
MAEARGATLRLQQELQGALKAAMAEGGPVGAVEACHLQALPLTESLSEELGAEIGRTALRLRNPANAPDAWEAEQLHRFEERLAAGEPAADLEAILEGPDGLRYMKAIPMQEGCAACHGAELAPALGARIKALYPQDRATGFSPGTLRGAFTVTLRRP